MRSVRVWPAAPCDGCGRSAQTGPIDASRWPGPGVRPVRDGRSKRRLRDASGGGLDDANGRRPSRGGSAPTQRDTSTGAVTIDDQVVVRRRSLDAVTTPTAVDPNPRRVDSRPNAVQARQRHEQRATPWNEHNDDRRRRTNESGRGRSPDAAGPHESTDRPRSTGRRNARRTGRPAQHARHAVFEAGLPVPRRRRGGPRRRTEVGARVAATDPVSGAELVGRSGPPRATGDDVPGPS